MSYQARRITSTLLSCAVLFLAVSPAAVLAGEQAPWGDWVSRKEAPPIAKGEGHRAIGPLRMPVGEEVGLQDILESLRDADYVLLGEIHDNPDHHMLQAWLLGGMIARGHRPSVVWEMLARQDQEILDSFAGDADAFAKAVSWDDSGWPDWSLYRPIADVALNAGLPQFAGNLNRKIVRAVAMEEEVHEKVPKPSVLFVDRPLEQVYQDDLDETIVASHCGLLPQVAVALMRAAQRVRDAAMALSLREARQLYPDQPAVLIAGGGHVRQDYGVAWYLRQAEPDAKIVSFVPREWPGDVSREEMLENLKGQANWIWLTPPRLREDPCVSMGAVAKRLKERAGESAAAQRE